MIVFLSFSHRKLEESGMAKTPLFKVRSARKDLAKLAKKEGETGAEAYESQLAGGSARAGAARQVGTA